MTEEQPPPSRRPPAGPVRERSKRPGLDGWHGGRSKTNIGGSEMSNVSGLSTGTSSVMNRSVIWDGYKHQKESVTAIVTNTLVRAEEKLERSLKIDPSERQLDRSALMNSEDELFVSDSNFETDLGDMQSELRDAEEAYRTSADFQDMEQNLNAILDSPPPPEREEAALGDSPPRGEEEAGFAETVDVEEGHLPTLTEGSNEFSRSFRKDEPQLLETVVESPSGLSSRDSSSFDKSSPPKSVPDTPHTNNSSDNVSSDLQPPNLLVATESQPLLAARDMERYSQDNTPAPPSPPPSGKGRPLVRILVVTSGVAGCSAIGYYMFWMESAEEMAIHTGFGLGVAFGVLVSAVVTALLVRSK